MNNLTLLWGTLIPMEVGKDVVLLPYYLGNILNFQTNIVCEFTDGVETFLIQENDVNNEINFINRNMGNSRWSIFCSHIYYLLTNAKKIDLLMCFHWTLSSAMKIILYKSLNHKGKVYLKLDSNLGKEFSIGRKPIISFIRKCIYTQIVKLSNVISCETSQTYKNLCLNSLLGDNLAKKLILVPNGFDENKLNSYNITERLFSSKENLIITVGRLGSLPKNTNMILKALEKVDLKSWKFCLIGPIEKEFQQEIDLFYKKNPTKKHDVIFIGNIIEKKDLWEWYNRAKVFVFTSRWESYGLVLNEAKRFRNYLLSTDVGAFKDLYENGKYGRIVNQDDAEDLTNILQEIVNGDIDINVYGDEFSPTSLSYIQQVKKILPFLN